MLHFCTTVMSPVSAVVKSHTSLRLCGLLFMVSFSLSFSEGQPIAEFCGAGFTVGPADDCLYPFRLVRVARVHVTLGYSV